MVPTQRETLGLNFFGMLHVQDHHAEHSVGVELTCLVGPEIVSTGATKG